MQVQTQAVLVWYVVKWGQWRFKADLFREEAASVGWHYKDKDEATLLDSLQARQQDQMTADWHSMRKVCRFQQLCFVLAPSWQCKHPEMLH
jgi:hypothetical protein